MHRFRNNNITNEFTINVNKVKLVYCYLEKVVNKNHNLLDASWRVKKLKLNRQHPLSKLKHNDCGPTKKNNFSVNYFRNVKGITKRFRKGSKLGHWIKSRIMQKRRCNILGRITSRMNLLFCLTNSNKKQRKWRESEEDLVLKAFGELGP